MTSSTQCLLWPHFTCIAVGASWHPGSTPFHHPILHIVLQSWQWSGTPCPCLQQKEVKWFQTTANIAAQYEKLGHGKGVEPVCQGAFAEGSPAGCKTTAARVGLVLGHRELCNESYMQRISCRSWIGWQGAPGGACSLEKSYCCKGFEDCMLLR